MIGVGTGDLKEESVENGVVAVGHGDLWGEKAGEVVVVEFPRAAAGKPAFAAGVVLPFGFILGCQGNFANA